MRDAEPTRPSKKRIFTNPSLAGGLGVAAGLLLGAPVGYYARPTPPLALTSDVYFSPQSGCTKAVAEEINKATLTIRVEAYDFTSEDIARALINAHKSGVRVEVLMDNSRSSKPWSLAELISQSGVVVRLDNEHACFHNKVMVLDEYTVVTGSFNFTKAAEERNAENLVILHDRMIASKYNNNWAEHWAHSVPFSTFHRHVVLDPISPEEATKLMSGQACTVKMMVARTASWQDKIVFLNSQVERSSAANFTIVVYQEAKPPWYRQWEDCQADLMKLTGTTILVSGRITRHGNEPQIEIRSADGLSGVVSQE